MMSDLRLLRLLTQVRMRGTADPIAAALIMTEMRFRGPLFRLCEAILAWWIIFIARREPRLTLGTCQVSFSFWRQYFGKENRKILVSLFDDLANYEVCALYLSQYRGHSLDQILIQYNGHPSYLYATLFYKNLRQAREICARLDGSPLLVSQ